MMKKEALALLGAALLVAGCSSAPKPQQQQLDRASLQGRDQLATRLAKRGELRAALLQRKILQSFGEEDAEAATARRKLEARIEQKLEAALESGAKALAKGNGSQARQHFLTALSLDPANAVAREELQALETGSVRGKRARVIGALRNAERKATRKKAASAAEAAPAKVPLPAKAPAAKDGAAGGGKAPDASRPDASRDGQKQPSRDLANGRQEQPRQNLVDPKFPMERTAYEQQEAPDEQARQGSLQTSEALIERTAYEASIASLENHLTKHPNDEKAYELLAVSHREIGLDLYGSGKLREAFSHLQASRRFSELSGRNANKRVETALAQTKKILADEGFEKGLRAFNEDLDQAIAYWEEVLAYDPQHSKTKLFLYRAYKIKENLQAVKP